MAHESNGAGWDTDDQCQANRPADQRDTVYGILPRTGMPPTVLMTELNDGTLVLQGRPDGPRAYLEQAEAIPLKRELTAAFERTRLAAAGDDQGDAR